MSESKKVKLLFFGIILIAFYFRFHNLNSVPPSLTLDEVATGYNAYSILETGKDEYGNSFPLVLRSYDDYKPALYSYTLIPFVKLLGLNSLSIRLPSALFSLGTVIVTFFLLREFLRYKSRKKKISFALPFAGMFLIAISPWHIYFSRLSYEANVGLFFSVLGIYAFFLFLNTNKTLLLLLSALGLGLSFNSYQSSKIFIPILVVVLIGIFYKHLFQNSKATALSVIVFLIVVLPMVQVSFFGEGLTRFGATNIFLSREDLFDRSSFRILGNVTDGYPMGFLFDHRYIQYPLITLNAFTSHLNPSWLYTNAGAESFKVPDFGLFYLFELPLLIIGGYIAVAKKILDRKIVIFLLLWIVAALVPGSLTTQFPHATRSYNILPSLQIIEALGAVLIVGVINGFGKKLKLGLYTLTGVVLIVWVLWFNHAYFVNFERELGDQFQYGALEAMEKTRKIEGEYDTIIVTNHKTFLQSYMFYLFSNTYDPHLYLQNGGSVSGGFDSPHWIGKYTFINPQEAVVKEGEKILFVVNPGEISMEGIQIIDRVYDKKGEEVAWLAERRAQ